MSQLVTLVSLYSKWKETGMIHLILKQTSQMGMNHPPLLPVLLRN